MTAYIELSTVYMPHASLVAMIEQVNVHWELDLRDHAFAFPVTSETFQLHKEFSFAFDVIIGHVQGTACHVLF